MFFDGLKGQQRISVCPIEDGSGGSFVGQEYIGLYKLMERLSSNGQPKPYVTRNSSTEAQSMGSFVAGISDFSLVRRS